jgi:hypothetical protein
MANLVWELDGGAYHATVETSTGGVRFRLVVERMNGSWDWTVWNPAYPAVSVRQGVTNSVQEAMRAAEQAVE